MQNLTKEQKLQQTIFDSIIMILRIIRRSDESV